MATLKYGTAALSFMFQPEPSMGAGRRLFPADFGYSLWVTYGVWVLVVLSLYPLCHGYANFKAEHRNRWLSYL
ncbi:MAG: hypothetical protein JO340_05250 [Acidobacteriaceae bacterium]|nr:hypothetical protein [Acidobacteriaceae bacterium]